MSRTFFYYGAIRKSIIKFLNVFDNIKIAKYNNNGEVTKYVTVPVKFMPKKKFYSWINHRSHEKRFPMIGVQMTSIEYDSDRRSGAQETLKVSNSDDSTVYTTNPVPYNIGFTVSIGTEYQNEQDQINEQLMPFFAPYVYTSINISELNINWDMEVLLNSANIDTETEIEEDNYRNILWTHEYTAKTYLLKPTANIENVKKIVHKFYLSEDSWEKRSETEMPSGQGYEDEELLVIGSKEDDEILAKYMVFN